MRTSGPSRPGRPGWSQASFPGACRWAFISSVFSLQWSPLCTIRDGIWWPCPLRKFRSNSGHLGPVPVPLGHRCDGVARAGHADRGRLGLGFALLSGHLWANYLSLILHLRGWLQCSLPGEETLVVPTLSTGGRCHCGSHCPELVGSLHTDSQSLVSGGKIHICGPPALLEGRPGVPGSLLAPLRPGSHIGHRGLSFPFVSAVVPSTLL